jgi:hypothetical protein
MGSLLEELAGKHASATADARLYAAGVHAYRSRDIKLFVDAVRNDDSLMLALAQHYLSERIERDMQGDALVQSSGRSGLSRRAEGQKQPATSSGPVESGGANSGMPKGRKDSASPLSSIITMGRQRDDSASGRPAPNPPRPTKLSAATREATSTASLFDTIKFDGVPIGNMTAGEFRRKVEAYEANAGFGRELLDRLGPIADPAALMRTLIKPTELWAAYSKYLPGAVKVVRPGKAENNHAGH